MAHRVGQHDHMHISHEASKDTNEIKLVFQAKHFGQGGCDFVRNINYLLLSQIQNI